MLFSQEKAFWDLLKMARFIHMARFIYGAFSGPVDPLLERVFLAGYLERIYEEQKWQKYAGQWHP
jgi:hypothetical protein